MNGYKSKRKSPKRKTPKDGIQLRNASYKYINILLLVKIMYPYLLTELDKMTYKNLDHIYLYAYCIGFTTRTTNNTQQLT